MDLERELLRLAERQRLDRDKLLKIRNEAVSEKDLKSLLGNRKFQRKLLELAVEMRSSGNETGVIVYKKRRTAEWKWATRIGAGKMIAEEGFYGSDASRKVAHPHIYLDDEEEELVDMGVEAEQWVRALDLHFHARSRTALPSVGDVADYERQFLLDSKHSLVIPTKYGVFAVGAASESEIRLFAFALGRKGLTGTAYQALPSNAGDRETVEALEASGMSVARFALQVSGSRRDRLEISDQAWGEILKLVK